MLLTINITGVMLIGSITLAQLIGDIDRFMKRHLCFQEAVVLKVCR